MNMQKFLYKAISVEHHGDDNKTHVKIELLSVEGVLQIWGEGPYLNMILERDYDIHVGDKFAVTVESLPREQP